LSFVVFGFATFDPSSDLHTANHLGHCWLLGQHNAGELFDAHALFVCQGCHDAPFHQAQSARFDNGVEFVRNQVTGAGQQVCKVTLNEV
jgi:hypothetical protein